jgi:hypothetical protein
LPRLQGSFRSPKRKSPMLTQLMDKPRSIADSTEEAMKASLIKEERPCS